MIIETSFGLNERNKVVAEISCVCAGGYPFRDIFIFSGNPANEDARAYTTEGGNVNYHSWLRRYFDTPEQATEWTDRLVKRAEAVYRQWERARRAVILPNNNRYHFISHDNCEACEERESAGE
jgi:hypothetical protein